MEDDPWTTDDDGPPIPDADEPGDGLLEELRGLSTGAHYVRADLHIHVYPDRDVTDERMAADAIVEQAEREGLAVIGVVTHDAEGSVGQVVAAAAGRELLVLPGVEIGTQGGHVVALFAPERLDAISTTLTRLRVGQRGPGTDESVVRVLELVEELGGIGLLAHIDKQGCFESLSAGARRLALLSPSLIGVEIAFAQNANWYGVGDPDATRRQLLAERRTAPQTRMRPDVARTRGSDAHRLEQIGRDPDGAPRVTRLKLEERSFDAVRLAFRDPHPRVRIEEPAPPATMRIVGLGVEGGFLDGARFVFSDNLTCIIGGRGTGKSTVLETLRWVLGRESATFVDQEGRAPESASVFVEDTDGHRWRVDRARYGASNIADPEGALLPEIEVYSQGEIKELADQPSDKAPDLLAFIDRFIEDATAVREEVAGLRGQLSLSDHYLTQVDARVASYDAVRAELDAIDKKLPKVRPQLEAVVKLRKTLDDNERARREILSGLASEKKVFGRTLQELTIAAPVNLPPDVKTALNRFNDAVSAGMTAATTTVEQAAGAVRADVASWSRSDAAEALRARALEEELAKQGLRADLRSLQNLLTRRSQLAQQKDQMQKDRSERAEHRKTRDELLAKLDQARLRLHTLRDKSAKEITRSIDDVLEGGRVQLGFGRDRMPREYLDLLLAVARGSGRHETTLRRLAQNLAPRDLHALVVGGNTAKLGTTKLGTVGQLGEEVARELVSGFRDQPDAMHRLEHVGRDDLPIILFVTPDGTEKPFDRLSQGQKHTILLSIAFSGTRRCPLLIDQPEDELDNLFVFQHVVARLRDVKERRQVILVSHNANIVVLGDSELIYVLRRGDKDHFEMAERGSIDGTRVRAEVVRVLEGGELALERRREMYLA